MPENNWSRLPAYFGGPEDPTGGSAGGGKAPKKATKKAIKKGGAAKATKKPGSKRR
jgi:hypothetical protein